MINKTLIDRIAFIFGSRMKAQEVLFVLHGIKPVLRQGFYPQELRKVEQFCTEHSLVLVKSRFKILLADEEAGNFSNKGLRLAEDDPRPGMVMAYISCDEQKAWLASYFELIGNDKDLGLVLGYPACCVDFFCRNFSSNSTNLEHQPTTYLTNLSKRGKDAVLLPYFPCSSDCRESIRIAQQHLELLQKIDRTYADMLVRMLR